MTSISPGAGRRHSTLGRGGSDTIQSSVTLSLADTLHVGGDIENLTQAANIDIPVISCVFQYQGISPEEMEKRIFRDVVTSDGKRLDVRAPRARGSARESCIE